MPAYKITLIRREAIAASAIEAAFQRDNHQAGRRSVPGGDLVGGYLGPYRRFLYELAGSRGTAVSVTIVGDESARAFYDHAAYLPNVQDFHIDIRPGGKGQEYLVKRLHIDAAARCRRLDSLWINGDFAPGIRLAPLSRLESIRSLKIETHHVPCQVIEDIGKMAVDTLWIYGESADTRLPSKEFASFEHSPIRTLYIWGQIDDRALELIAAAPRLKWLEVTNTAVGDDPADPQITNEGLRRACEKLHVRDLKIDAGVFAVFDDCAEAIAGIQELRHLDIAALTPQCRERIKELRPDIDIR